MQPAEGSLTSRHFIKFCSLVKMASASLFERFSFDNISRVPSVSPIVTPGCFISVLNYIYIILHLYLVFSNTIVSIIHKLSSVTLI